MSARRASLCFWLILAAGLALRLAWYIGPFTPDCFGNAQFAYQAATGTFDISKEYYAANRIGFLFPIALAVRVLGFARFAYSVVGLLCSLGCIGLAYLLGKRAYDSRTGLVAAAILAVMPLEIFYWSPLLVDSVTPFYWGASFGLFYLGLDDPPPRQPSLLLFASGAILGLASYTREHAPIVFFVMLAYLAVRRVWPPRRVWWVLVGFAAVVVMGEAYYFAATGVLFLRVRRLWQHFGPGTAAGEPGGALEIGHVQGLRPWFLQSMLTAPDYFGFLFWFAWICAVVLLVRRRREDRFALTWFLALYLAMDFVLRTVVRLLAYPPYINVLDLPAALVTARVLAPHLAGAPRGPKASVVTLGAVLALGGAAALWFHHALASSVDVWGSTLGSWGRAHAHDARFETMPVLVGSLFTAAGLWAMVRRARWGGAALLFLVVSSLFITAQGVRWRRAEVAPLREMASIVASDDQTVYMTSLWPPTAMSFFLGYRTNFRRYWNHWESVTPAGGGRTVTFREPPDSLPALAENSYLVLDKRPVRRMRARMPADIDVVPLPAYVLSLPPTWRLLLDSPDYSLYRVLR